MAAEHEPTRDELAAMAYADGELPEGERRAFEARMMTDAGLARLVAEHKALEVLSRLATPPEPMDTEWRRLERDPMVRLAQLMGWLLFVAGGLGIGIYCFVETCRSQMGALPKLLLLACVGGLLLLFLVIVHARLSTLPYDPYRNVER